MSKVDISKLRVRYKETLKAHKLKVKDLSKKLDKAKTNNAKVEIQRKMNELKITQYKDRKDKFGFYEELNYLKNKNIGKRNLTREEINEWNKWKKSFLEKAGRIYEKFMKENKNLDFSRVSFFARNKYGREKFSGKYLLNMTMYMIPTKSEEFKDLKDLSERFIKRLKKVKPRNRLGYYSNSSFHIGDIYVKDRASLPYVTDDEEKNGFYDDKGNFREYFDGKEPYESSDVEDDNLYDKWNDIEDSLYDGVYEDELENAYTEWMSDNDYRMDDVLKDGNIVYKGPFKVEFNVSNTDLIENIEVIDKSVTLDDYDDLEGWIDRHKFPNRVNMRRFKGSIKRRETWRRKRLEKEGKN